MNRSARESLANAAVLSLAVGSGATWALVGPWRALRLARIDQATRRVTYSRVRRDVGWLATDNTGLTPGVFGLAQGGAQRRFRRDVQEEVDVGAGTECDRI